MRTSDGEGAQTGLATPEVGHHGTASGGRPSFVVPHATRPQQSDVAATTPLPLYRISCPSIRIAGTNETMEDKTVTPVSPYASRSVPDWAGAQTTDRCIGRASIMITRLLSPSTESALFSADKLPEAVQGTVLQEVMTPLVKSESMLPTIQKGDELEIEQAEALQAGDVVLYRHDELFVCHRIHRIERRRIFVRGDANAGPFEEVDVQCVLGRVRFLIRDGRRISVRPCRQSEATIPHDSVMTRAWTWTVSEGRSLALRFINWVAEQPIIQGLVRSILRKLMVIEIMEQVSLHSLDGYARRERVALHRLMHLQPSLSPSHREDIMLVVRAGPIHLGTCTLDPWSLHMRPLLHGPTTELLLEAIGPSPSAHSGYHSIQRATPVEENQ